MKSRKSRKVSRKSRKVSRNIFDSGTGSSKTDPKPNSDPKLKELLQRLYRLPGVIEYYSGMKNTDIINLFKHKNRNDESKKAFKEYKEETTVKIKENLSKDVNSYIKNNNIKNLEEKEEEIKNYILELIKE